MNAEVSFDVPGLPPTKNEALSLFNPEHGQHDAVIRLLTAARAAIIDPDTIPHTGPLGIEIVVTTAGGRAPADATNYLGGIGDVLQARGKQSHAAQYGLLGGVALFADDGQLREVRYRERAGSPTSYSVRIWNLTP